MELLESIVRAKAPLGHVHPELAYFMVGRHPSWDKLLAWVTTVIGAHTRDSDGQEATWRDAMSWRDFTPADGEGISALGRFRMPLVAALFRLADELDVTHPRVPNLHRLLAESTNIPLRSLTYWACCYFVDQVRIEQSQFRLCVDQTKFPPGDERLRELGEFLVHNYVHDKLRRVFLKGITPDTPSIQRTLLAYKLPLLIEEPERTGGPAGPGRNREAREFLRQVLEALLNKPFSGTVPISTYAIRGCVEDASSATGREVRRIRLIDETSVVRVPEVLRLSFLRSQPLQASRAMAFMKKAAAAGTEVITFSERGVRMFAATSAVLAAAAHIDRPEVTLRSGSTTHKIKRKESLEVLDFGRPTRPNRLGRSSSRIEAKSSLLPWRKFTVPYSRKASAVVSAINLHGTHLIIWPPDNDHNPVLSNFLSSPRGFPPGRDLWLQRTRLLEEISRQIVEVLGVLAVSLSVLDENPPHAVLTFSVEADACITFSGGAMAAAGEFAIRHNPPGFSIEGGTDGRVVRLTTWYEPSQQFDIIKTDRGNVQLSCQVRRVLEGRLFI
jgi:hypothetical protein